MSLTPSQWSEEAKRFVNRNHPGFRLLFFPNGLFGSVTWSLSVISGYTKLIVTLPRFYPLFLVCRLGVIGRWFANMSVRMQPCLHYGLLFNRTDLVQYMLRGAAI